MRGQPDAHRVVCPSTTPKRPVGAPEAGMKPVVFNHKAHEASVDSCRTCHHVRIESCTVCHHRRRQQGRQLREAGRRHAREDLGQQLRGLPSADRDAEEGMCRLPRGGSGHARRFLCHLPQGREGHYLRPDSPTVPPSISRRNSLPTSQPRIWPPSPLRRSLSRPFECLSPWTIGALSNDFEPSVFPHRKIYEALVRVPPTAGLPPRSIRRRRPCVPRATTTALRGSEDPPKCASCHGIEADKMATSVNNAFAQGCVSSTVHGLPRFG